MVYKKYIIFSVFLLCMLLLYFFLTNLTSIQSMFLEVTDSSIKKETDVVSATKNIIKNKEKVQVDLTKENTCYWFRSTKNNTKYVLEINEYEYSSMKGCFGQPKATEQIILEKPINLKGISCLCNGDNYELDWKDDLKINKLAKNKT